MLDPVAASYGRHRKRVHPSKTTPRPFDYVVFGSHVNQGSTESLIPFEETWDRETMWPLLRKILRSNVRTLEDQGQLKDPKQVREYLRFFTMQDVGGPFFNKKETITEAGDDLISAYVSRTGSFPRYYDGPVRANVITNTAMRSSTGPFGTSWDPSSDFTLDSLGSTAISRCAPTNPTSSAFQAIAELYRDGLPKTPGLTAIQDRGAPIRGAGGEYLNYQFGIAPTISDARSLYSSLTKAEKLLAQWYRDSGRLVRRQYSFPESIDTTTSVQKGVYPATAPGGLDSVLWLGSGETRTTVKTTTKVWFSGAFTYYAKYNDDLVGRVHEKLKAWQHLLGVEPSPEALWSITPWSWAIDWKTNMGDIMNNLSMFSLDGLCMRYGYVMEHKVREVTYHHYGSTYRQGSGSAVCDTRQVFKQETKRRRAATPWGFGLDPGSFSDRQWAILAALGATRGRSEVR